MKTYLITYDLINPKANLDDLIYAIQLIAVNAARPLPKVWKITSAMSAADIRDHLAGVLEPRDRLVVSEARDSMAIFDTELAAVASFSALVRHTAGTNHPDSEPPSLPC